MARRASLAGQSRPAPGWHAHAVALDRPLAALEAHWLLLALLACYVAIGLFASLLIPPWQAPDEPAHFEYARNLQLGVAGESPEVQRPIIESFYTFRFWELRGVAPPATPPASFSAIPRLLVRQTDKTPLYYWLAAGAASWTDDLILQLYSMRWLSVLLSAVTIPLVYLVAREVLPPGRAGLAVVAAALVAFLPMYGYIGASVNPDNIGAPLAAAMVLLAVRALRGKQPIVSVIGALLLALLAFWARRSTIAGIPWALLVAVACGRDWARRRLSRPALNALALAGGALVLVAFLWPGDSAGGWLALGSPWGATRSARYAYEGAHSLHIARGPAAQQAALIQALPVQRVRGLAGHAVVLDAMVRGDRATVAGHLAIAGGGHVLPAPFVAAPDWQHVTLRYTVPTDTLNLSVMVAADSPGELFVDRVRLLDEQGAAPAALVSNGDAEQALRWWQQRFSENRVVQYLSRIIQSARDGVYGSPEARALYPYFLYQLFTSFVGRFGWMIFGLGDTLIGAVGLIGAALLLGLARGWRGNASLEPGQRRALAWMALLIALTLVILLLEYTSYLYAPTFPQGRYLFPVLAPIACLLVGGLAQWLPARYERHGMLVAVGLLVALDAWSWLGVIVPYFYR